MLNSQKEKNRVVIKELTQKRRFDNLFRKYYEPMLIYAHSLLADNEASRDAVGDAFVKVWDNMDKVTDEKAEGYIFIIVRNTVLQRLRRKKQFCDYARDYSQRYHDTLLGTPPMTVEQSDAMVDKMLNELQPPTRDILEMCYLKHMKYAEVAALLGISESTVKKHISKALAKLKELRDRHFFDV